MLTLLAAAQYEAALDAGYPLADEQDPKAQAAIAFLCLKGMGVKREYVRAADWYRRAAQRGCPETQFFLGTLCEIALAGGITAGLDCRDAASARMTRAEIDQAYRTAAKWLERRRGR